MKQTAVEWLVDQLDEQVFRIDHVERRINISISFEDMMTLKKEAKEMEKEKMIEFANNYGFHICGYDYENAEQYYNETHRDDT
jgi:cell division septum initiation protein DivIVA